MTNSYYSGIFWLSTLKFEIKKAETQFKKQLGSS